MVLRMSRQSRTGGATGTPGVVVGGARHHRGVTTRSFTITPVGEFSLAESALFGFGQRMRPAGVGACEPQFDAVMRLAFCLDGYQDQVGIELRQDERGVHAVVHGPGELDAIHRQVACSLWIMTRVASLRWVTVTR